MHGIYLGKVASKGAPSAHLYPSDGLHRAGGLDQGSVARLLPGILEHKSEALKRHPRLPVSCKLFA